jgi:hypothetical protein
VVASSVVESRQSVFISEVTGAAWAAARAQAREWPKIIDIHLLIRFIGLKKKELLVQNQTTPGHERSEAARPMDQSIGTTYSLRLEI